MALALLPVEIVFSWTPTKVKGRRNSSVASCNQEEEQSAKVAPAPLLLNRPVGLFQEEEEPRGSRASRGAASHPREQTALPPPPAAKHAQLTQRTKHAQSSLLQPLQRKPRYELLVAHIFRPQRGFNAQRRAARLFCLSAGRAKRGVRGSGRRYPPG